MFGLIHGWWSDDGSIGAGHHLAGDRWRGLRIYPDCSWVVGSIKPACGVLGHTETQTRGSIEDPDLSIHDPCRRTGPERGVALAFMYPCVRDARVHVCVCIRPLALGRWLAGQTVGQLAWRLDWRDARARAVAGERRS